MPVRLDSSSADFAERFASFLATKREVSADIEVADFIEVQFFGNGQGQQGAVGRRIEQGGHVANFRSATLRG